MPCSRLSLLLLIATVAGVGCPAAREPRRGGPAARVVATTPSSTEMVAAAGGLARLVGVDRFSHFPAEVERLPKIGDFLAPDIDGVLALRPDLAVLDAFQRDTARKLELAGVATISLDVHRIADVVDGLRKVGAALGTAVETDAAIARIDAAVAATRSRAAARPRRIRALLVVDRQPGGLRGIVAAGPGSYLDELLGIAGGENVLAGLDLRYPKIGADRVVEAAPEVILDATHGGTREAWQEVARVPAVAAGRVHLLDAGLFQAPNPRIAEALIAVEGMLHPPAAPAP